MIIGQKILLRAINKNDAPQLLKLHNDIKVKELAMFHPFPVSMEQELTWIDSISNDLSNKSIYFAIEEIETGDFAGYTSLRNINYTNRNCYFGITLLDCKQNKGFGKEATNLICDFAFKNLNMNKIILEVNFNNKKAIDIYKKNGFVEEGKLSQQFFFNGKYSDVLIMAKFNN